MQFDLLANKIANTKSSQLFSNHSFPIYSRSQTWEKVNIVENPNGTISFNQKRVYHFSDELSTGSEDDVVIVPNIPMLSATSQSKHAARSVNFFFSIRN